jgi:hypothetical protein
MEKTMLYHFAAILTVFTICSLNAMNQPCYYHEELLTKTRANDTESQHICLTCEYLKRLDGVTFMVDGYNIKEAMCFIKGLIELQLGKIDKKINQRIGNYELNGKKYGIHELAKIEKDCTNTLIQQQLQELLKKAKLEVMDLLRPFVDVVGATRWIVTPILEEWIEKRQKTSTLLIKWKDCPGTEEVLFNKMIQSFVSLTRFCTDLRIFLGDLIHNCPKGYAQFEELLKQHEQQK